MSADLKNQIRTVRDTLIDVVYQPKPTLGIDLDGCCDESAFFNIVTHVWPGEVIVVTFRRDRDKTLADLTKNGIRYTDVVLVETSEAKADVIRERGVSFFIDDQPEMLKSVAADVGVLLFRNEGKFDFDDRKWIMSDKTGKLI